MNSSKTAFVFPGQGSQAVGMLAELASIYSEIKSTFSEASETLGYDLWDLSQVGPQEKLNLTEITQPLLLASSVAIWRVWKSNGGNMPVLMGGHSLGEYSALVCSGVIAFQDAVNLVRQRGKFMQDAVPVGVGAMSAVLGLDDDKIIEICTAISKSDNIVEAVNFNSPGQVVIAGHASAVNNAGLELKEAGAKRVAALPVSAPFHTSLMKPVGKALAEIMSSIEFLTPQVPIVHNVNASVETEPESIRQLMVEQTSSAVQWTRCVQYMVDNGVTRIVECGPGKVLSGLSRRIHKPLSVVSFEKPDALTEALSDN